LLFIRSDIAGAGPPADGQDGPGNDRSRPVRRPPRGGGGVPLPDAAPARVRLREPARLADLLPDRSRRPAREPGRSPRVPSRV
jgi:hypothetical protein